MKIKINKNLSFSDNGPPLVIAEVSANHGGSKKKFLQHIIEAKKNGADLVKIQTYEPQDMVINKDYKIKRGLWKNKNLYKLYIKAQTPFDWHKDAFKIAKKNKIELFSTPFSIRAFKFLNKFKPNLYKIASFEITDLRLINEIAKTKKPIILSTGLANKNEILDAIKIIKKYHSKIVILHCISGYPTPIEEMNIQNISYLKKLTKINFTGLSDHSIGTEAAELSCFLNCCAIEKHFILNKKINSPDSKFSINKNELRNLKKKINYYFKILGNPKNKITKSEKPSKIFRRSIYSLKDIKKGEKITHKNVGCFRPNIGISANKYYDILNKKTKKNIKKYQPLYDKYF
tara:strand:+ start:274 stop:1308 length:1035 start_codon:yes stop_codon:yes gene_type:complete